MRFFDIHIVKIVSSISAQKLMCLGSARNLHSSGSLELENSSSNSSLEIRTNFYRIDITSILEMREFEHIWHID